MCLDLFLSQRGFEVKLACGDLVSLLLKCSTASSSLQRGGTNNSTKTEAREADVKVKEKLT